MRKKWLQDWVVADCKFRFYARSKSGSSWKGLRNELLRSKSWFCSHTTCVLQRILECECMLKLLQELLDDASLKALLAVSNSYSFPVSWRRADIRRATRTNPPPAKLRRNQPKALASEITKPTPNQAGSSKHTMMSENAPMAKPSPNQAILLENATLSQNTFSQTKPKPSKFIGEHNDVNKHTRGQSKAKPRRFIGKRPCIWHAFGRFRAPGIKIRTNMLRSSDKSKDNYLLDLCDLVWLSFGLPQFRLWMSTSGVPRTLYEFQKMIRGFDFFCTWVDDESIHRQTSGRFFARYFGPGQIGCWCRTCLGTKLRVLTCVRSSFREAVSCCSKRFFIDIIPWTN